MCVAEPSHCGAEGPRGAAVSGAPGEQPRPQLTMHLAPGGPLSPARLCPFQPQGFPLHGPQLVALTLPDVTAAEDMVKPWA